MGVDGVPDAADLHVGVAVDEGGFFAIGGLVSLVGFLGGFLRGGLELNVRDRFPVVGEALRDDEFGADGGVVGCAVVVVVC